jgi:hypothetical protein
MTRTRKGLFVSIALAAFLCLAAASARFAMRPAVVDQGGRKAYSAGRQMRASVGGPVLAETASSSNYKLAPNTMQIVKPGGPGPVTPPPDDGIDPHSLTGGGCAPVPGTDSPAAALALLVLGLALAPVLGRPKRHHHQGTKDTK